MLCTTSDLCKVFLTVEASFFLICFSVLVITVCFDIDIFIC